MALIEALEVVMYSPAVTNLLKLMQSGYVYPLPCMANRKFSIRKPISRRQLVAKFWNMMSTPTNKDLKINPYDPEVENACEELLDITCALAELTGVSPASIGVGAHVTLMVDLHKADNHLLLKIEPYVYAAKMLGDHYVSAD